MEPLEFNESVLKRVLLKMPISRVSANRIFSGLGQESLWSTRKPTIPGQGCECVTCEFLCLDTDSLDWSSQKVVSSWMEERHF